MNKIIIRQWTAAHRIDRGTPLVLKSEFVAHFDYWLACSGFGISLRNKEWRLYSWLSSPEKWDE